MLFFPKAVLNCAKVIEVDGMAELFTENWEILDLGWSSWITEAGQCHEYRRWDIASGDTFDR